MQTGPVRVCFPFTGDVVGGSHYSVLGLVRNLDPDRFVPVIVPQHADGAIARFFAGNGLRVETPFSWTELPYDHRMQWRRSVQMLTDLPRQVRYLRANRFAIVHTNDGRTHATWAPAARLAGSKLLWHHRGDPAALGLRLAAPLLANTVVAVSQFAMPRPGIWSAASKARVVHSAFATDVQTDRSGARAALISELGCSDDTVLIGFFGAFSPRKRPHLFIDAIAELVRALPGRSVMGLMFGEAYDSGKTEARLASYVEEKKLGASVRLMGFRSPGPYWLAACDILLISATHEPFGRTLIEAMLVGTPIVATASGGNIEALREGTLGVLTPPENARGLAMGARTLVEQPERAQAYAQAARRDAQERFGEDKHAYQIMAIYDELLSIGGRAQPTGETIAMRKPRLGSQGARA